MNRMTVIAAAMLAATVAWPSTPVMAEQGAVSALAGSWEGWWDGSSLATLNVVVNADGTYVSHLGAERGAGTFRMVNGALVIEGPLSAAAVAFLEKNGA